MKKTKIKPLSLLSIIGFSGKVSRGLRISQTNELVYPVGKNVGIWAWKANAKGKSGQHCLLKGHRSSVVALSLSTSGDIIASAENASTSDWATVIIWSEVLRQEIGRHSVHREEVTAVAVASNGNFVFSMGGESDGKLIVWDVEAKKPVCSTQVCEPGYGIPHILCSAPFTPTILGVGGRRVLKVFCFDETSKKFASANVTLGLMERHYTDLKIDEKEEFMYCATTTGDVVKIRLNLKSGKVSSMFPVLVSVSAPKSFSKNLLQAGRKSSKREAIPALTALVLLSCGDIIAGDSKGFVRGFRQESEEDKNISRASSSKRPMTSSVPPSRAHGTMKIVRPKDPSMPLLKQLWSMDLSSYISSLDIRGKSLYIGNQESEIHEVYLGSLDELALRIQMEKTSHRVRNRIKSETKGKDINDTMRHTKNKAKISRSENPKKSVSNSPEEEEEGECLKDLNSFVPPSRLLSTCPPGPIYDVTFPKGVTDLIVTAGEFGIRVWNVRNLEELLRVGLHGIACKSCVVSLDLSTIITGWMDGRVRGVGAESGVLKWVIDDAHHKSVNCLAVSEGGHLVSGGADGRVRTWSLMKSGRPNLFASVRQHRGEVMSVAIERTQDFVLSCSADGLSILWTLPQLEAVFSLKADTVFFDGRLLNRQEIVTVGSDGSVLVWHRGDGSLIADLRVVQRPLTSVDVSEDEKVLVTSEEEGVVKVWNWSKGRVIYEGRGHSAPNTKVKISPDGQIIVSVSKDGTIIIWKTPKF